MISIANKKLKELGVDLSSLSTSTARIEQFNTALAQQRLEISKAVDDLGKKQLENQKEVDKRYQIQFEGIQKSISELQKVKEPIAEIQQELKTLANEDTRLGKLITARDAKVEAVAKTAEEVKHAQKLAEDSHRQDFKRLADLQGEVNATRKRIDEGREKNDLVNDSIRRVELRLNEIVTSEAERRQAQTQFIESQNRAQVDRDRLWKDVEDRLLTMRKQTETMDHYMQEWDTTQRAVTRARESYEEITQKFERRINEISEMQRLAEDRFRQEWVTFKADDQKRWSGYMLSQDETHKDARLSTEKIEQRITSIEDLAQTQQDVLQQTKEANEQLFQGMLAQIHELLSAYERIMSTK